jgi:hypothetical protein
MAQTMLHNTNLPYSFWAEAINTATYIRNRCISRALNDKHTTLEEIWTGRKPNVKHLRIFGCDAYMITNEYRHKFEPKATKCILVGYSIESKAYRLWNNEKQRIIISRDVKFNELTFERTVIPTFERTIITDEHTESIDTTIEQAEPLQQETSTSKSKGKARLRKQLETTLGSYWSESNNET